MKKNEQRGEIKSPVDGVVLERLVSDERQVAPGTVLLRIGRLEELQVEADVLSQDVVDVKAGNEVEISGPAIGAIPAHGTVERVYPAGFTKVSSLGVEQQRVKVIISFNASDLERLRHDRGLGTDYRVSVRIITQFEVGSIGHAPIGALPRRGRKMAGVRGSRWTGTAAGRRDWTDE